MQGVQERVLLQRLPSNLGLFAYTFLRRALNLGQPSDSNGKPNVAEVNNVLRRHLCADQRQNHIFTFGTLELENERCVGPEFSASAAALSILTSGMVPIQGSMWH